MDIFLLLPTETSQMNACLWSFLFFFPYYFQPWTLFEPPFFKSPQLPFPPSYTTDGNFSLLSLTYYICINNFLTCLQHLFYLSLFLLFDLYVNNPPPGNKELHGSIYNTPPSPMLIFFNPSTHQKRVTRAVFSCLFYYEYTQGRHGAWCGLLLGYNYTVFVILPRLSLRRISEFKKSRFVLRV